MLMLMLDVLFIFKSYGSCSIAFMLKVLFLKVIEHEVFE